MKFKTVVLAACVILLQACAGESSESNDPSTSSDEVSNGETEESFDFESYKNENTKMFVTSNDKNARTHFIRELESYNHWNIVDNKEDADFQIHLYEKMKKLDRVVWVDITAIESDSLVYTSPSTKGVKKGLRTLNLKEQAVKNLVHEILAPEFFN